MKPPARVTPKVLALTLLLIACSGATLTLTVPPLTIPAHSTAGSICYAQGEATGQVRVRTATYRAQATYRSHGGLIDLSDSVEVLVYGRADQPASTCVTAGDGDIVLGGPFSLVVDEPSAIVVGAGDAAVDLAQLVNGGDYWIGVALDAGFSLGGERTITFDEGRVTVTF